MWESLYKLGVIVSVLDKITGPTKKMAESIINLEKTAKAGQGIVDYGQRMAIGGALIQGAADKMAGAVKNIYKPMESVEGALAPLYNATTSTMGGIEKSLQASARAAGNWEKIHVAAADEYLRNQYLMASAGLNDIQSITGTNAALAVATATMGENASAAKLLATVYNNIGDKTKDVNKEIWRLADVITKSQVQFQYANLDVLNDSLKYAIPAALQSRMGFEELNVVLGYLNRSGLEGSLAGTAYTMTMAQMLKASKDLGFQIAKNASGGTNFIGTLENITKKYGPLAMASDKARLEFQKAFGVEGIRAISLLQNKTGDMKKSLGDIRNSLGATAEAQKVMESTSSSSLRVVDNNINSFKRTLAVGLLPTVEKTIPNLRKLIETATGFAKSHPQLTKTVVLMVLLGSVILSILAPILTVGAGFMMAAGYFMIGYSKIVTGVKLVSGLLSGRKLLSGILFLFRIFTLGFRMVGGAILRVIPAIWSFTAALLANPITWVVLGVIALGVAIYLLIRHWKTVKTVTVQFFTMLGAKITGMIITFKQSGAALWEAFTDGLKSVINKPVELVKAGLQKIRNLLPFSDAKVGPLSKLTRSGSAVFETFASGMKRTMWLPSAMAATAMGGINLAVDSPGLGVGLGYSGRGIGIKNIISNNKPIKIQNLYVDRKKVRSSGDLVSVLDRYLATSEE